LITSLLQGQEKVIKLSMQQADMDAIADSSMLQKKLNTTSQKLIEKQIILDQKMKFLEKNEGQVAIREKDVKSRISTLIKMQKELDIKKEEFENENLTNEKKCKKHLCLLKKKWTVISQQRRQH
jgi:hypothetical protein